MATQIVSIKQNSRGFFSGSAIHPRSTGSLSSSRRVVVTIRPLHGRIGPTASIKAVMPDSVDDWDCWAEPTACRAPEPSQDDEQHAVGAIAQESFAYGAEGYRPSPPWMATTTGEARQKGVEMRKSRQDLKDAVANGTAPTPPIALLHQPPGRIRPCHAGGADVDAYFVTIVRPPSAFPHSVAGTLLFPG